MLRDRQHVALDQRASLQPAIRRIARQCGRPLLDRRSPHDLRSANDLGALPAGAARVAATAAG